MRPAALILLTALATTTTAAPAAPAAASSWQSWSVYVGDAPVQGASGTHVARLTSIVLPDSFKVRKHATKLTFGRVGACKSTGVIAPKLVFSTKATSAAVLREQLVGGATYGQGTRGDAVYRVARFTGGALKGIYVRPTRIAQTWIVVQATTTPHGTCHTGGIRESVGFPLTDAFGTVRASGY